MGCGELSGKGWIPVLPPCQHPNKDPWSPMSPQDTPFAPGHVRVSGGIDLPEPARSTLKRPCPRRPRDQPRAPGTVLS